MHHKRTILWSLVVCSLLSLGCGKRYNAMQFLQPDTGNGKRLYLLLGSDEGLIDQGRISVAREFQALDETKLATWIIRPEGQSTGTVVLLHGLGESRANYLSVGEHLADMGYSVVMIDLRRHGRSGGEYVTHGIKERFDVSKIVDTLLREQAIAEPLYAAGVNLGGVVALQYAVVERRVQGVMAVDAYADLESYATYQMRLLPEADRQEALAEIQKQASFRVKDASALNAVRQLRQRETPILLAYGVFDFNVPRSQTQQLFAEASEPKDLVFVDPIALSLTWPKWMAQQIDRLATTRLKSAPAE